MKWLMDGLDDLAGLDMVLLREAGFDREAEPLRGEAARRTRWIDAIIRRATSLVRGSAVVEDAERRCPSQIERPSSPSAPAAMPHPPSSSHAHRSFPHQFQ